MQFDENPAANIENMPLDDTRESIQQDSNRPQGSDNNKETENWNNRFFFSFSLKVVGAPPKKLKKEEDQDQVVQGRKRSSKDRSGACKLLGPSSDSSFEFTSGCTMGKSGVSMKGST
jgi:hypothetical protein